MEAVRLMAELRIIEVTPTESIRVDNCVVGRDSVKIRDTMFSPVRRAKAATMSVHALKDPNSQV